MEHDITLYVGLDVQKDSITVAYALGMGEMEQLGKFGTSSTDIDRLCRRLQSKALTTLASPTRLDLADIAFTASSHGKRSNVWCARRR